MSKKICTEIGIHNYIQTVGMCLKTCITIIYESIHFELTLAGSMELVL